MMLDEEEWQLIKSFSKGTQGNYMALQEKGLSKQEAAIILHRDMVDAYNKLTGVEIPYEDWHLIQYFCLKDYGPDCNRCDLPLRSSRATLCANCGTVYVTKEID